jgi:hypothetical protein
MTNQIIVLTQQHATFIAKSHLTYIQLKPNIMKKVCIAMLLLGMFSACNVSDVESDLTVVTGEEVQESNDCFIDLNNLPSVTGSTWLRTSFIIQNAIDGNGDGVYSTDLEDEYTCAADPLFFRDTFIANNPTFDNVMFQVTDDGNGNLTQVISCLIGDGIFPNYSQEGNIVRFCYSGELEFTGTLSDNEQTLTFVFENSDIFFQNTGNPILQADGTTVDYQGNATIIYTRQ